jgi:hypothetical protein
VAAAATTLAAVLAATATATVLAGATTAASNRCGVSRGLAIRLPAQRDHSSGKPAHHHVARAHVPQARRCEQRHARRRDAREQDGSAPTGCEHAPRLRKRVREERRPRLEMQMEVYELKAGSSEEVKRRGGAARLVSIAPREVRDYHVGAAIAKR